MPPFAIATLPVTFVALVAFVAVAALPSKVAVIVPAEKSPLASLETIEFGVLKLVAVVAVLLTFPAVVIVESFESEIDPANFASVTDESAKSTVSTEPFNILSELMAPVAILAALTLPLVAEVTHHKHRL